MCPGEANCDDWQQPRPDGETYEQKVEAICRGCKFFETKPAAVDVETIDEDEIEDLVAEIADIVTWENAGVRTDWSVYPFETMLMARVWRDAEREVSEIRQHRMQVFLRSWFEKK